MTWPKHINILCYDVTWRHFRNCWMLSCSLIIKQHEKNINVSLLTTIKHWHEVLFQFQLLLLWSGTIFTGRRRFKKRYLGLDDHSHRGELSVSDVFSFARWCYIQWAEVFQLDEACVKLIFSLVLGYYYRFSQPRDHLQWRLVHSYYD